MNKRIRATIIFMATCFILLVICVGLIGKRLYMNHKPIEDEPKETETETESEILPMYTFTDEERYLIARVLYNEAGSNTDELRDCCLSVMINQWVSGRYGKTITDVISRKNAYVGYALIDRADGADLTKCYESIDRICMSGSILPDTVVIFSVGGLHYKNTYEYYILEGVVFESFTDSAWADGEH